MLGTNCSIHLLKIIITCLLIQIFAVISPLYSKETIGLNDALNNKNISRYLEYIEDEHQELKLDTVVQKADSWRPIETRKVSFGWTNSQYWFRFVLKNKTAEKLKFYIELDNPLIDFVELYIPQNNSFTIKRSGDAVLSSEKDIADRTILFLENQASITKTYYFRVKTTGLLHFNLSLLSTKGLMDKKDKEYPLFWMFYGLIITLVLYNSVIFFFIRQREYLYYSLFLIFSFLWHFNDSGFTALYFFPDSPELQSKSLILCIALVYFWFAQYIKKLTDIEARLPVLYKVATFAIQAPCLIIAALTPFLGHTILLKSLYVFQLYLVICLSIIGIYDSLVTKSRQTRIILLAFFPLIIAIPAFLLSNMGKLPSTLLFKWMPALGISLTFIILSIALADKINIMSNAIQKAEEKYRNLVESSNDVIFSLDSNYNFISVNNAFGLHLGFKANDVIGKNFLDFIQDRIHVSVHFARDLIKEYLNDLMQTTEDVNFKTDFRTAFINEPLELSVKLEYVKGEHDQPQILGKASILTDDIIVQYLKMEKHTYEIDNYLNLAELISQRLTRNLNKLMNISDVARVRIALREIIINAIEHGNLNIQFNEKTQALSSGTYFKFIQSRQRDSRYMNRRINIEYFVNHEKVEYRVTDEGGGFDHQSIENIIASKSEEEFLSHGRGITLARDFFDELVYNERGNSVVLVKYFSNNLPEEKSGVS